jgi:hypothetical protein
MKKLFLTTVSAIALSISASHAAVIFTETLGTVSSNTGISTHNTNKGFDNDDLTFTGTGDLRATTVSNYLGASGSTNVFLTNSGTASFMISGISTLGYEDGTIDLSFGAYKSTTTSTMSDLALEYSVDGETWTTIVIPAQASGGGTAVWRVVTLTATDIPITETLSLKWTNTGTTTQYRLDDFKLSAVPEPATALLGALGLLGILRRRR